MVDNIEEGYRFHEPAEKTCNFIDKQQNFNKDMEITMTKLVQDLGYIKESLKTHIEDQKIHDAKVEAKLDEANSLVETRFEQNQKTMTEFIESMNIKVSGFSNWKSWVIGIVSGVILLAGLVASLLTYIYFSDINRIKADLDKHIYQKTIK